MTGDSDSRLEEVKLLPPLNLATFTEMKAGSEVIDETLAAAVGVELAEGSSVQR